MSEKQISARMQQKIDLTANWEKATNFIPKKGEIIVYSDGGGVGVPKMKVGDGTTKVGSLKFIESDGGLSAARNIKIYGGAAATATSADFDGTKNITIPLGSVYGSYLSWGGQNIVEDVSPIDAAMSYLHSANRAQFSKPAGITIEYSNDSGSTWTDYGADDITKISLVSGKDVRLLLGKVNSGTAPITAQLRITINANECGFYSNLKTVLINYTTDGSTGNRVMVERANIGSETNFTSTIGTYDISGWSGWNSLPLAIGAFGGNASQTSQCGVLRFTFSFTNTASNARPSVLGMMFLGITYWNTPSNMARTGHIYDWDTNQNAIFPAGITATSFNGSASKVANSLTLNGKSFDGSSAVSLSSQQLGVPSAFIAKSVSVLDCNSEKIGRVLSPSAANSLVNGPAEIGSTGAGVLWNIPLSAPTSSINEAGTQQKLYQIFVYDSGKVYLRKNSSNDTATWTYGTWEKLLTDVNITADNITTALGYAPVKDVQVAGVSVLTDGVANVPMANKGVLGVSSVDNYSIGTTNTGSLFLYNSRKGDIDTRSANIALTPYNLDYAVTAAMTDGKGPAWTAAQQAAARERMGIPGDYELIEEITISEAVTSFIRESTPDGTPYSLAGFFCVITSPGVDKAITLSQNIWAGETSFYNYGVRAVDADVNSKSVLFARVNNKILHGEQYPVGIKYEFANVTRFAKKFVPDGSPITKIAFSGDIPANTKITIYGVRA